jgi:hypothetical protein
MSVPKVERERAAHHGFLYKFYNSNHGLLAIQQPVFIERLQRVRKNVDAIQHCFGMKEYLDMAP